MDPVTMLSVNIQLPFSEPVLIIALLLTVFLIGPVLFERMRLPAVAGLLISGALIGPNGFNLLSPDLEFTLLGTIGLLYLMFLAGLEIDLVDFMENRIRSLFTGLATFIVPFTLGFVVFRYFLDYEFVASWLIAAMLSSHTLISYPILNRLGIVNRSIVTVVVGATIIADVLALISMEVITNFTASGIQTGRLLIFGLQFLAFIAFMLFVIPRISRIFLRRYEGDLGVQYIYVLFILFLSALVAYLLDIEPILGAFFSGLMLNRLVINTSPLYKRIEFVGSNLFIPFFLVSIGVLTNFKVYFAEPGHLVSLFILLVVAFGGKYLAALLAKGLIRTTGTETNLLFGLSVSRAASAIAIILVGFNLGLISEVVLNNTVMLILLTSISSSYITQRSGKRLLMEEEEDLGFYQEDTPQKILVPLANPFSMQHLLEFASLIKEEDRSIPVYPLTVITDKEEVRNSIDNNQREIARVIGTLHSDVPFEITTRIDNNVTSGIARVAAELNAGIIVMGWNKSNTTYQILFGNVLKHLLKKTDRKVIVLKTPSSFGKVRKIHLFCPENAQFEKGFHGWIDVLMILIRRLQVKVHLYSTSGRTIESVESYLKTIKAAGYFILQELVIPEHTLDRIPESPDELVIFVHARKKAVSHDKQYEQHMNRTINRLEKNILVVIYPS